MKYLSHLSVFVFIIGGLSLTFCKKENQANTSNPNNIYKIQYGTSFGMCVGYCKQSLDITSSTTELTKSGWSKSVKTISCNEKTDSAIWNSLVKDINVSSFNKLQETFGCPDCADGGAEWVQIVTGTTTHKITFEYHNEPQEVKQYIDKLRSLHDSFKDCNN
jgi:hypothetical protein